MQFQNTIAFGQLYSAGGVVDITTSYVNLEFTPTISLIKNLHIAGLTSTQTIVNDFEVRVLADGGVFEAEDCLEAQLIILNNIA